MASDLQMIMELTSPSQYFQLKLCWRCMVAYRNSEKWHGPEG